MSNAERSVKELVGPIWERWSPEQQSAAVSSFKEAVSRLAKQIEADIYVAGTVKPAPRN